MNELRNEIVDTLPTAIENWQTCTAYHSNRWAMFCERAFGIHIKHLVIKRDETLLAYLPLITHRSKAHSYNAGPAIVTCIPSMIFGDNISESLQVHGAIRDIAPAAYTSGESQAQTAIVAFNLNLDGAFDTYWSDRVDPKARYDVRKAERIGVATTFDEPNGLEAFHPLYCRRMHELGSPALGITVFERLKTEFGSALYFAISRVGETVVAASVVITHKQRWMGHPWSVSHSDFRQHSVNYAHYRDLVRFGYERGIVNFYLGSSLADSSWCRIKRRFGGVEIAAERLDGKAVSHPSEQLPVRLVGQIIRWSPHRLYRAYSAPLAQLATRLLG